MGIWGRGVKSRKRSLCRFFRQAGKGFPRRILGAKGKSVYLRLLGITGNRMAYGNSYDKLSTIIFTMSYCLPGSIVDDLPGFQLPQSHRPRPRARETENCQPSALSVFSPGFTPLFLARKAGKMARFGVVTNIQCGPGGGPWFGGILCCMRSRCC